MVYYVFLYSFVMVYFFKSNFILILPTANKYKSFEVFYSENITSRLYTMYLTHITPQPNPAYVRISNNLTI